MCQHLTSWGNGYLQGLYCDLTGNKCDKEENYCPAEEDDKNEN